MSRRRAVFLFVLAALAVLLVSPSSANAECYNYSSSHVIFVGFTPVCGGSGGSCGECHSFWGGGTTVCTSDSTGFQICIDYQF